MCSNTLHDMWNWNVEARSEKKTFQIKRLFDFGNTPSLLCTLLFLVDCDVCSIVNNGETPRLTWSFVGRRSVRYAKLVTLSSYTRFQSDELIQLSTVVPMYVDLVRQVF
ncbi:hypothetical protein DIRU0_E23354 [Diutina rugosa]